MSRLALLAALLGYLAKSAVAAPAASAQDPCAAIAGKDFVPPAQALACLKSFPFNETLRQNVLTVVSRVFDFYTFEYYYLDSPAPFQESTVDIRAEIARINATQYATDYDFNHDLYQFTARLNDGHTRWLPTCYRSFPNFLPAPVVTLEINGTESVFVVPDLVDLINLLGDEYTSYFASIGFDWERLAGAHVLEIGGMDAYAYADLIASTNSSNYLDHGVRVNSVFSGYKYADTWMQKFGDIANPALPDLETLTMKLVLVDGTEAETVTIPFLASYTGQPFTDKDTFWDANCAANADTNGVDLKVNISSFSKKPQHMLAKGDVVDNSMKSAVGLPSQFEPKAQTVGGNDAVQSYILPDKKTGVLFVGSFAPFDYEGFQTDIVRIMERFEAAGLTQLIVDVTNNNGGYICLGQILHAYLTGTNSLGHFQNPGFQSTNRATALAQKIVASDIALGVTSAISFYTPDNWASLNNMELSATDDYMKQNTIRKVNGKIYNESKRFGDVCEIVVDLPEEPLFSPENIAIVGNGLCASTCAMFATLMYERHNTTIATFGGKPGLPMQYRGMAGNQVLEWVNIDTEIKIANLKDDPLAPPDLLVNADFRHNWRIAYSFLDESTPIQYRSELPHYQFPYTVETYNHPQNLWTFAAEKLFT
ncbi:hypothetical protein C8Q80DRAFT_1267209 [Daedaleopsis nitida]|nr:hypothetical protein C8Q80DRAFT_1267209 [Daedaleopsis nitida]